MQEHKIKQPYFIHYGDERVMAMAGLYDNWKDAEGNWLTTFTILTTASSEKLQWYAICLSSASFARGFSYLRPAGFRLYVGETAAAGSMTGCLCCCRLRRWRLHGSLMRFLMPSALTTAIMST